jgi:hypothetical protein
MKPVKPLFRVALTFEAWHTVMCELTALRDAFPPDSFKHRQAIQAISQLRVLWAIGGGEYTGVERS